MLPLVLKVPRLAQAAQCFGNMLKDSNAHRKRFRGEQLPMQYRYTYINIAISLLYERLLRHTFYMKRNTIRT